MNKKESGVGKVIDAIHHSFEEHKKTEKDIYQMQGMFDELDLDAKHALWNAINFLLTDEWRGADIYYKDHIVKEKLEKIMAILRSLPEKHYESQCKLLIEKIKKQDNIVEAFLAKNELSSNYPRDDEIEATPEPEEGEIETPYVHVEYEHK